MKPRHAAKRELLGVGMTALAGVGVSAFKIGDELIPFGKTCIGRDAHGAEHRGIVGKVRFDQH